MASENLVGRTVAGYRLLELVGEGGTATVYRASHEERGSCAVKILKSRLRNDPTAIKRFLREASYGARAQHPSLVRTYDYGEADGLHYLALEWVEGELLSDFAQRSGPLPPSEVSTIVEQLAQALAAAHAAGIIHRDLKPENIIYEPEGRKLKLLDFGIARDSQLDASERLTRTGFFVGTLQYVAPEALSGELVDQPADTYSLATISYYLLTNTHPFTGRSPRELFRQLLTQSPLPLNQAVESLRFPQALEDAVMKGLAREPERRPASVIEFAESFALAAREAPEPVRAGKRGLLGTLRSLMGGGSGK